MENKKNCALPIQNESHENVVNYVQILGQLYKGPTKNRIQYSNHIQTSILSKHISDQKLILKNTIMHISDVCVHAKTTN